MLRASIRTLYDGVAERVDGVDVGGDGGTVEAASTHSTGLSLSRTA